ncbi:conserved hypothetical protein [Thermosulfidibacter takaii ABI70S6]|uniref:DUF86 domain-containing protein n=1 Tax=Thermosulfidibacter takaii (strain DSM 17441 / JCM 13301 / NBRC 103674 / ABI70S6) TaxID=1298851 RepID=A0A0S3QU91_THET7|nr:DUF86 domain-containing protein [Thermosulfidibacter takaii]BAT71903.1 conserved hypothetical protein [Thermosulfidibacter takaii ABI70S6]
MREIRDYLADIKIECEYLISRSKGLGYEEFIQNEELKRAFVRSLEVIGEAAKHIPEELREKFAKIKWKNVVAMRNVLIHEYFGVDYKVIWKTVKVRIPELYGVIMDMIEEVDKSQKGGCG